MEEVFDKIKVQANRAKDEAKKWTKTVIDKTNNVVNQTKLKFAINETKDKINEIYAEIGKTVYEESEVGGNIGDAVREKCEKIDALQIELGELKEQLAELKETVKCPKCGAYNHIDDVFCSKCGEKLTSDEDFAEQESEDIVNMVTEDTE